MMVLKTAKPKDLGGLLEFIEAYYRLDGLEFDKASIRHNLALLLESPQLGSVFLLQQAQASIGYCILTYAFDLEFGGRIGYITDLFIETEYRGKGLGQQALEDLETFARNKGLGALELQVEERNLQARGFYQKSGFSAYRRTPMSKRIAKR